MKMRKKDMFKLIHKYFCTLQVLKKIKKNPDVDTSFLPDREREEADLKLREELRLEWVMTQASLKDEPITVTFSYWDGSGHRRNVTLKKGSILKLFSLVL